MLDCFEHVLPKAPLLADLLSSCPGLKIVVTSRSLLHLGGEYEFPVRPLEIPDMREVPESEGNLRAAQKWLLERKRWEEAQRLSRCLGGMRGEASALTCLGTICANRGEEGTAPNVLPLRSTEPLFPLAYEELTAREIEVLRLLALGLNNKQIAGRLIISPHTVNGHVHSIFGKLALNSRSAATHYALEHQLA
jgi:DNA-binding CsgD family transcriptional regulator